MYQVLCDEKVLSDIREDDLTLYDTHLAMEDNLAGSFSFTMQCTHPQFGIIKKISSWITIKKNGKIIFKGRVMDDQQGFNNTMKYSCEGQMAVLNDSIFRPFEFKGSPKEFLTLLIKNHNSQVAENQRLKLGDITVKDPNDYITRSSINHLTTWELINSRLLQLLGGHIRVRYGEDGDYLDYLEDYEVTSLQSIHFGENLLDFTRDNGAQETYTAMIPLGAETNGKRLGISSVNNGKDYIVNEDAVQKYGIIFAPEDVSTWGDVTLPNNLLTKARAYLDNVGVKLKETIQLSAVDLNLADNQIESFNVCEYINIISAPHGIRERQLLRKLELDLNNLQSTRISLGETRRTLTDIQAQNYYKAADVSRRVDVIEKEYLTGENVGGIVEEVATEKVAEVLDGYISNNLVPGENVELQVQADNKLKISALVPKKVSQLENDEDFQDAAKVQEAIKNAGIALSPTITEKTNTDSEYILTIKDINGLVDTPNLIGKPGTDGENGLQGQPGINGKDGSSATIKVGTVTTGSPETKASVENVGTESAAVFNFTIPMGAAGSGGGGGSGGVEMFAFEIRADGHLWLVSESENASNFYINEAGHLIYRVGE